MGNITMLKLLYSPELVKIWQEDFSEVMPFGEDGGLAINNKYTRKEAWSKMKDYELKEYGFGPEESVQSFRDLKISYLHLPTEKEKVWEDWEWVISRERKSKLKVWAYWA